MLVLGVGFSLLDLRLHHLDVDSSRRDGLRCRILRCVSKDGLYEAHIANLLKYHWAVNPKVTTLVHTPWLIWTEYAN